jgi:hypothetical protein
MDGDERFVGPRRVPNGMHAGIVAGDELTAGDSRLVLEVYISVRRQMITLFDRFSLQDLQDAKGTQVIVGHAGLARQPGHDQHFVGFSQYHESAIVGPRIGLHILCHIVQGQPSFFQRPGCIDQRGSGAQVIELFDKIEKAPVWDLHDKASGLLGLLRRKT